MLHRNLASCTVGGISANTKPANYCITMNLNLGYISLMESLEMLKRRNSAFCHSGPHVSFTTSCFFAMLANTQLHSHTFLFRLDMLLSQNYYWSHGNLYDLQLPDCSHAMAVTNTQLCMQRFSKINMQFQQVCVA